MGQKKKIYIVVKTYPTISKEYAELVCTAGVLEDGSWTCTDAAIDTTDKPI
ncbi:MAG: hypothetical protein FWH49_02895 [Clostridiales bacterium]|nr:hypothetical protein [Clostridiales bacterium]